MDMQISEITDRIDRFSMFVPDIGPTGFTFNQYLIDDEQPLLFHIWHRAMSPHRRRHGDDHATRASSLDRLIIVVGRSSDEPLPQTAFRPSAAFRSEIRSVIAASFR